MTDNTTAKTDKELFAEYLKTKANSHGDSVGKLYLSGFEFHSLDDLVAEIINAIVGDENDPEPLSEMDLAIEELQGLLANLRRVRAGFIAYKESVEEAA